MDNLTKLMTVGTYLIHRKDDAKIMVEKYQQEGNKEKELYWLGRLDALAFALEYVNGAIRHES